MEEFWLRLEEYIRAYLPDWQYQRAGSEPEAALMTVLGELLARSREELAALPADHRRQYLGAWGGAPREAEPMYTCAAFASPAGARLPAGSVFYCSGDGARLWETAEDTWAPAGRLAAQAVSSEARAKFLPLPLPAAGEPVKLFDFDRPGAQRQEARFRHPAAFGSRCGCQASLRLETHSEELLRFLSDPGACRWYLETDGQELALPAPSREGEALSFRLPAAGPGSGLLARAADGQTPPAAPLEWARVETARAPAQPVLALNDDGPCPENAWLPFGARLMPWRSCCVSCPDVLDLPGAQITLRWRQTFRVGEEPAPETRGEPAYRPVMRQLPPSPPPVRRVRADQVAWEYWNGTLWRAVPGAESCTGLFAAGEEDDLEPVERQVRLCWPADAQPCEVRGVKAYWLRWRLLVCEGAGWLPARYYAPLIRDLRITAVLPAAPVDVESRCWPDDGRPAPAGPARRALFPAFLPRQDSWWLGFDAPPGGQTLSLYVSLRGRGPGGRLSAWEAESGGGERPLSLRDRTEGLAHSGMLTLTGIRGDRAKRFGKELWWLCLREESGVFGQNGCAPTLLALAGGAVLLRAAGEDRCRAGERFSPLRGGPVTGAALTDSFGGAPRETEDARLRRLQTERHHLGRIVSAADAEQLIRSRVRGVAQIRCVRSGDTLEVGVLMRDTRRHEQAFQLQKDAIRAVLDRYSALPSLGLAVRVREPSFYPIHVMVWVRLRPGQELADARRRIGRALDRFLDPDAGHFGGTGWRMGALPTPAQIRASLRDAVPDLALAELVVSAGAPGGKEQDPAAVQDPFALPAGGAYTLFSVGKEAAQ